MVKLLKKRAFAPSRVMTERLRSYTAASRVRVSVFGTHSQLGNAWGSPVRRWGQSQSGCFGTPLKEIEESIV